MPDRLHLYTIPPHRAFADALANGLIKRFGGDPMGLARGLVLLPNNRAKRAWPSLRSESEFCTCPKMK